MKKVYRVCRIEANYFPVRMQVMADLETEEKALLLIERYLSESLYIDDQFIILEIFIKC